MRVHACRFFWIGSRSLESTGESPCIICITEYTWNQPLTIADCSLRSTGSVIRVLLRFSRSDKSNNGLTVVAIIAIMRSATENCHQHRRWSLMPLAVENHCRDARSQWHWVVARSNIVCSCNISIIRNAYRSVEIDDRWNRRQSTTGLLML